MKVWVYVDGFNLYKGRLQGTPYKWLDLLKFSQVLLPNDQIDRVKYFSAKVDARAGDPGQPLRQIAYWQALRTVPQIEIIEGHFLSKTTLMPDAASVQKLKEDAEKGISVVGQKPTMVEVFKSEEKGTDVNLATHLVNDAHLKHFEAALIVSNDSGLHEALRIVKTEIGLTVGVFSPHPNRPSAQLKSTASFFREIKSAHLKTSQFPTILTDVSGHILATKPATW